MLNRSTRNAFLATLLIAFASQSCRFGDEGDVLPTPSVGTQIVAVDSTPVMSLGAVQGQPFYRIADVLMLTSGGFVVASRSNPSVFVLDSSGNFRSSLGRSGQGPGEFLGINGVHMIEPDTVVILDTGQRRITKYRLDGQLISVLPLEYSKTTTPIAAYRLGGVSRDGRFLLVPDAVPTQRRPAPGPYMDSAAVLVYQPDGKVASEIGLFWRMEMYSDSRGTTRRPLGLVSAVATDTGSIWIASDTSPTIRRHGHDGRLIATLQWAGSVTAITSAAREAYIESRLKRARNSSERKRASDWYRALRWPEKMPYYSAIVPAVDALLIAEPVPDNSYEKWRAVD